MGEFLGSLSMFSLVLTLGAYQLALYLQKKTRCALCSPLPVSILLVIGVLLLTGVEPSAYRVGTEKMGWLLTPATVCLALPLYQQLLVLKKNLGAILTGVTAGTVTSLVFLFFACRLFRLDAVTTVSLLPKSITAAMGMALSQQNGGIVPMTTAAIVLTGNLGALTGRGLCRLLKISHPIAQGVGFGTASHVIGTTRAGQLDPLAGAVSSLSLAVAGILTAVLLPIICTFL